MDKISVFITNYNGERVLGETIAALKGQDYPNLTISLIDDGSSDKSIELVKHDFPDIDIIGLGYNTGHPNKLRNLALRNCKTRYVLLIDNDIVLEKNAVSNMISTMKNNPKIGICTPRLMYYNNRSKIHICWTKLHYLCASISPNRDTFLPAETGPVDTTGGGTMLIDKQVLDITGTIDETYGMGWGEDAEIYIRTKIAGFHTVYVPDAIGYHHAKEWTKAKKTRAYGQIYNRWVIILSMYQIKTILFIFPALLIYELFLIFSYTIKMLPGVYLSANFAVVKNIFKIYKKRKSIQTVRRVKDKEFLTVGPIYIPAGHLNNPVFKFGIICLDKIFIFYWYLIKILL